MALIRNLALLVLSLCTAAVGPALARAPQDDSEPPTKASGRDSCIDAFERAQPLRNEGKLLDARRALAECSVEGCPEFVRAKCIGWYQEVQQTVPSLVVSATAPDGSDASAVRVFIDGQLATAQLDGRPIELEPGEHTLKLEMDGLAPRELRIIAKAGERRRTISVSFEPLPTTPKPNPPDPSVTPTTPTTQTLAPSDSDGATSAPLFWAALGIGAAGIVLGGITGALAFSEAAELEDRCAAGGCTEGSDGDDLASAKTVADVSTVGFIAGGVFATVGLVGLLVGTRNEDQTAAWVAPILGPTRVGVRGSF